MSSKQVAAALCVFLRCVPIAALEQPSFTRPARSRLPFSSVPGTIRIPGFAQTQIHWPMHSAGATATRERNALTWNAKANSLTWNELNDEAKNNQLIRLSTPSRILRCEPRLHNFHVSKAHNAQKFICLPARSLVRTACSHSKTRARACSLQAFPAGERRLQTMTILEHTSNSGLECPVCDPLQGWACAGCSQQQFLCKFLRLSNLWWPWLQHFR